VAGRLAHVAKSSPICPHGVVVDKKRNIVEWKEGKRGGRWPAGHRYLVGRPHLVSTQLSLSFFTTSCSSHAHSTNQKHQK
jgi:G:T-mismatch repair DNA endonuclease (very short patch repair protein)